LRFGLAAILLLGVVQLAWLHGIERFRMRGLLGATIALGGIAVMFVSPLAAALPIAALLALLGGAGLFVGGLLVLLGVYVGALSGPRPTRAPAVEGRR
jgi:uncharacterized membrane protein YphA (DoxX/SURF4 family)